MPESKRGLTLVLLILAITTVLWLLSKDSSFLQTSPLRLFSQLTALLGLALLSVNILFTTRLNFLEDFFGGLDKVYKNHHLIGGIAFMLLLSHPILLAINNLSQPLLARSYLLLSNNLAYNFGVISVYLMIGAFLFIAFINLPYHQWKLTHRLLGVVLLPVAGHVLLISSDISTFLPLRLWVFVLVIIGLAAGFYTLFLFTKFSRQAKYKVVKIDQFRSVTNIFITPLGQALKILPGQFAYLSFDNRQISELHPFSISQVGDGRLRFSIKTAGDYTRNLDQVKAGDQLTVFGSYGRFGQSFLTTPTADFLLIAGGIGVTPFLSLLNYEKEHPKSRKIDVIYAIAKSEEAVFSAELQSLANCHLWVSQTQGRLTVTEIAKLVPDFKNRMIQICGPTAMMRSLSRQFRACGITPDKILMENFSMGE